MKYLIVLAALTTTLAHADEVSKKVCESFLPALGDQNIGFVLNGIRRDLKDYEKSSVRFFEILKAVDDLVSEDAQKRCEAGLYPIMNVDVCYMKCKTEVEKRITGTYAWNVQDRYSNINRCYEACTGAYIAQNSITRALKKAATDNANCSSSTNVFDSKKSKQIENILLNIDQSDSGKNTAK